MRSTRSASSKRNAINAANDGEKTKSEKGRAKLRELVKQLGKGQKRFFTCNNARDHSGYDGGACATVDPSKDTEEQAILRHCIDHSRHGEHRAQEAGEKNVQSGIS